MKFTIAEWRMIQALVDSAYEKVRDELTAMKKEATPEGKNWPDEEELRKNPDYSKTKETYDILVDIGQKLDNEEI